MVSSRCSDEPQDSLALAEQAGDRVLVDGPGLGDGELEEAVEHHAGAAGLAQAGVRHVERRGEVLDVGLARLRSLATRQQLALDALLEKLARDLATDDRHDDTAIVGIQWQN